MAELYRDRRFADFSLLAALLSFFVEMLERLQLPEHLDGQVWRYANAAAANRRHRHAELELNVVTRGNATYLLGDKRYTIRRGDLLWLFPAQEHVLIEQTGDFSMWIAVFRRRAVRRVANDAASHALLQRKLESEACRRLAASDLVRFEDYFQQMAAVQGRPALLNAGVGFLLLYAWKCFQAGRPVPVRKLHPAVERAAMLLRNETGALKLERVARQAGLSPSRLSRLFKEQTGSSMVDFRNRARLERFQHLHSDGTRTLLDAALSAGFGSYPQFHRVFRRLMGVSPQAYVRRAAV